MSAKEFWMGYKGLFTVLFICIVVFATVFFFTVFFTSNKAIDNPNEAGDTAGLANGLFSAFAFAGVIYAIFLQRNELELQREELRATRGEFEAQNETLKQQRFENTFFNMLQLQQQITENLSATFRIGEPGYDSSRDKIVDFKGREVFFKSFEVALLKSTRKLYYMGMRGLLAAEGFEEYAENYTPTYYDHYFRHLYRIFKFVAESPLIKDNQRYEYASMVRGQLSRYELVWLYYNGLSSYGCEKFKPLIEKFALLKNLRDDLLVEQLILPVTYAPTAFSHNG